MVARTSLRLAEKPSDEILATLHRYVVGQTQNLKSLQKKTKLDLWKLFISELQCLESALGLSEQNTSIKTIRKAAQQREQARVISAMREWSLDGPVPGKELDFINRPECKEVTGLEASALIDLFDIDRSLVPFIQAKELVGKVWDRTSRVNNREEVVLLMRRLRQERPTGPTYGFLSSDEFRRAANCSISEILRVAGYVQPQRGSGRRSEVLRICDALDDDAWGEIDSDWITRQVHADKPERPHDYMNYLNGHEFKQITHYSWPKIFGIYGIALPAGQGGAGQADFTPVKNELADKLWGPINSGWIEKSIRRTQSSRPEDPYEFFNGPRCKQALGGLSILTLAGRFFEIDDQFDSRTKSYLLADKFWAPIPIDQITSTIRTTQAKQPTDFVQAFERIQTATGYSVDYLLQRLGLQAESNDPTCKCKTLTERLWGKRWAQELDTAERRLTAAFLEQYPQWPLRALDVLINFLNDDERCLEHTGHEGSWLKRHLLLEDRPACLSLLQELYDRQGGFD